MKNNERAINWFEHTSRALCAQLPETEGFSDYLTEKLSLLLLERLPANLSSQMLELLQDKDFDQTFRATAEAQDERSIGFPDFVAASFHALGLSEVAEIQEKMQSAEQSHSLAEKVAETFLWAIAQEFSAELKSDFTRALPGDLKSRMNLYSGHAEGSQVA